MRKLLAVLIAGGLALSPAIAAPKKPHARGAKQKKGRRPTNSTRRRAQNQAKRANKGHNIPKSRKIV